MKTSTRKTTAKKTVAKKTVAKKTVAKKTAAKKTAAKKTVAKKAPVKEPDTSRLQRALHPMPPFVERALQEHRLVEAYRQRPAYQRNDYVGWISRAKQEATRQKRLNQMLEELAAGHGYMRMAWRPKS
ncbi:YdeI/OmpD-associated family protein [Myxococcaceae bacterium JPH2]|nr:YdeI/OmpD-associated family protein [Myxococcaceae bacterium JPH2]